MRAARRALAAAILLLACASCSRDFAVRAAFIGGRLAFVASEGTPRGPPWCLEDFAVGDRHGGIVWAIDDIPYSGNGRCATGFPLIYGQVPPAAKQKVAAQPLRLRELYVITGFGGDPYKGAFVLFRDGGRVSVENIDPDRPAALAARERIERSRTLSTPPGGREG